MARWMLLCGALLVVSSPLYAQTSGDVTYERLLLPVYAPPTPGGYGSMWTSEFWVSKNARPTKAPPKASGPIVDRCQLSRGE